MSQQTGKSRRRFLADLLFLGGGITAASMLAKSTFLSETQPTPIVTPTPETVDPVDIPSTRGEAVMVPDGAYEEPAAEGNFVIPEEQPKAEECPPQVEGQRKIPEPNPAGGMIAPPPGPAPGR